MGDFMFSPAASLHLEEFPWLLLWNEVIFHGRWASAQQGQKGQLFVISSTNITPPFLFLWCGLLLSAASSVARFLFLADGPNICTQDILTLILLMHRPNCLVFTAHHLPTGGGYSLVLHLEQNYSLYL